MQQLDTTLVTPEAVVLQFETAGLGSRLLSRLLDSLIQAAALLFILFVVILVNRAGVGSTPLTIVFLLAVFAVLFVYPVVFETLWRGRTPGKAALGLGVVTREGAPVRFRHAAIRSALWVVDGMLFGGSVAVISVLASRDNVRLGDLAAGTLVVRERSGARQPTPIAFPIPYGCEAYVATLDVSGVTPADYEAVRALLMRAPSLPPHVRWQLASQLGGHMAGRLRHSPPEWTTPELFLACVAAAYQQRSLASASRPSAAPDPVASGWGARPPEPPTAPPIDPSPPGSHDFAPPG